MPTIQVVDLYHEDKEPDFHTLKGQGVVGVILKATEGASHVDDKFADWHARAISVFGPGRVHSYHMMTGDDPASQIRNYLSVTQGMPGRWLDYELAACTLQIAIACCHALADKQGRFPGMYGSDMGPLGEALVGGHFGSVCPIWLASYSRKPLHKCDLWQFAEADASHVYDCNVYMGTGTCEDWLAKVAG